MNTLILLVLCSTAQQRANSAVNVAIAVVEVAEQQAKLKSSTEFVPTPLDDPAELSEAVVIQTVPQNNRIAELETKNAELDADNIEKSKELNVLKAQLQVAQSTPRKFRLADDWDKYPAVQMTVDSSGPIMTEPAPRAQVRIKCWPNKECQAGERLKADCVNLLVREGYTVGENLDDNIRFVTGSRLEACPTVEVFRNGQLIETFGHAHPYVLGRKYNDAFISSKSIPDVPQGIFSGPIATIQARQQVESFIRYLREYIGEGNVVSFKWNRDGIAKLSLLANTEWTASNLFGSNGRFALSCSKANLPINSIAAKYQLINRDVTFDLEPITFRSLADSLTPSSNVQGTPAGLMGIDDALFIWSVASMIRDIAALFRPSCDLMLPNEIELTMVLNGDVITVDLQKMPTVVVKFLFTFPLGVQKVELSPEKATIGFNGSRWVKTREITIK